MRSVLGGAVGISFDAKVSMARDLWVEMLGKILLEKKANKYGSQVVVAHTCNPSTLGV